MIPAAPSIPVELVAIGPGKWLVYLRDEKSRQLLPVVVPEADAEHKAISDAMNRAARFVPGCDWKPVSGRRIG